LFGNNDGEETPKSLPNVDDPDTAATKEVNDSANFQSTQQMLKNNPPPVSFPPAGF